MKRRAASRREAALAAYRAGLSVRAAAEAAGVSRESVRRYAREAGILREPNKRAGYVPVARLRLLAAQGAGVRRIAGVIGLSRKVATKRLARAGLGKSTPGALRRIISRRAPGELAVGDTPGVFFVGLN